MAGDVDAHHFAGDAAVEAFDHAIGLRRIGSRRAVNDLDLRASAFEIVSGKTGTPIRQDMGDAEREGLSGSLEEGDGVGGILRVVDLEMDEA